MTITGRSVFKVVYWINLLVQVSFISYQLWIGNELSPTYLTVALTSVVATSLLILTIIKNIKNNREEYYENRTK